VLYRTEDGQTRIQVRLIQESVWLTLSQIADLFQRDKPFISKHIKNICDTAELDPERTGAKFVFSERVVSTVCYRRGVQSHECIDSDFRRSRL
jgi:hypothetical protein